MVAVVRWRLCFGYYTAMKMIKRKVVSRWRLVAHELMLLQRYWQPVFSGNHL